MKKARTVMTVAALLLATIQTLDAHAGIAEETRDRLELARDARERGEISFYAANDVGAAQAAYEQSETEALRAPDSTAKTILLADINLARGELSEIAGEKKSAGIFFSNAYDFAADAYRAEAENSESCRVAADSGMRVLPYRSLLFKMSHGFEPKERAKLDEEAGKK